jgi:hypothetical protein
MSNGVLWAHWWHVKSSVAYGHTTLNVPTLPESQVFLVSGCDLVEQDLRVTMCIYFIHK